MSTLSPKDGMQVLRAAFDDATNRLRTDATFTGTLEVNLDADTDSVSIADGVDTLAVNADGSINTNLVGTVALDIDAASGDNISISDGVDTLAVNADGSINVDVTFPVTQAVSAASLPLPTGASTEAKQDDIIQWLTDIELVAADLLTDAQLRASPVPVSAAALPLPTGASTEATLSALNGKLPPAYVEFTQNFTGTGAGTVWQIDGGYSSFVIQATSSFSGLVGFYGSNDNVNYRAMPFYETGTGTTQSFFSTIDPGAGNIYGFKYVKLHCVTLTSGTPTFVVRLNTGLGPAQVISPSATAFFTTTNLRDGAGSAVNKGQTTMTGSLPVVIASNQSTLPVSAASLPLPSDAATETKQDTGNTKLDSLLTELQLKADLTETQPVSVASLPLPTGAATEATLASLAAEDFATQTTLAALNTKSAGSLAPVEHDEVVTTYVGATTKINTVVYKLSSVTVKTLTFSYDGSDRVIGVVAT